MKKIMPVSEQTASTITAWQQQLKQILTTSSDIDKIAVVGVGHPMRGDDYVGSYIVKNLIRLANGDLPEGISVFDAEGEVEAVVTRVAELDAKHIVFIDACEMAASPGETRLISLAETSYPFFTTHGIPLKVLAEHLLPNSKVWILAIQPETIEFSGGLSDSVHDSAMTVFEFVKKILFGGAEEIAD